MKKEEMIQKAYEIAVERYAAVGVDTEQGTENHAGLPLCHFIAGRLMM